MAHAAAPGTSTSIWPPVSQSSQADNVDQSSTPPNQDLAQSDPHCQDHVVHFQLEAADSPSPNPSPAETTPSPNSSTSANPNHPTTKPTMISSSTQASKTSAQVRLGASTLPLPVAALCLNFKSCWLKEILALLSLHHCQWQVPVTWIQLTELVLCTAQ